MGSNKLAALGSLGAGQGKFAFLLRFGILVLRSGNPRRGSDPVELENPISVCPAQLLLNVLVLRSGLPTKNFVSFAFDGARLDLWKMKVW